MRKYLIVVVVMAAIFAAAVPTPAQSVLLFDRGLPTANLNNVAGASRSNVAWSFGNDWITGDDFTIGVSGEVYVVTKVRGWSVQGTPGVTKMGDRFKSVTLYGGPVGSALSPLESGDLALGSSVNSNPNITHTRVQYADLTDYQGSSGPYIQLWQHDLDHLTWVINGGQQYRFATDGLLQDDAVYYWFNHASNAALSGSPQQGADGFFLGWDRNDLVLPYFWDSDDSADGGWDKSSDINVQVFGEKLGEGMATGGGWFIPETANSVGLVFDGSKANFGFVARNRKAVASGNLEFQYNASDINLKSSSYDWAQLSTSQAIFEGTGTINDAGSYKFRVRAVDGDKLGVGVSDRFEIRIWTTGSSFDGPLHRAEGNLGGGQIVVHKK